ncbi:Phosphatidylglycerol--prolipoprotein diacylglyceryl transferase [Phycisphaerales bacterium]|nr:Phosphatidylglycerol--prolipoprotein diacylglyceryl transferase [Phycisphaerales bacterium]
MSTTLAAWLHDLSPFLIRFGDGFGIRWYGVSYLAGFLSAWWMLRWFSRSGLTPMTPQRLTDAMLALVVGVVVGGRLGYVLFYRPDLIGDFSSSFPWWGVLRLNEGGMASHGGMAGVIIAAFVVARGGKDSKGVAAPRVPVLHVLDLLAIACTPGLFFGRLANFVNGELLGEIVAKPGQPAPWWSVKFPQEAYTSQAPEGQVAALRPILDPYRLPGEADEVVYERVMHVLHSGGTAARNVAAKLGPVISARHPSQLYQAAAEGLVLGALLWAVWRRPRKPGVVGCWFLLAYGVLRVLTELIRLPDAHLHVQRYLGLSRGQWLSVAMVAVGVVALGVVSRRKVERMGGWGEK